MTRFRWIIENESPEEFVYEALVFTFESAKVMYPIRTSCNRIGFYSTLEKAETGLSRSILEVSASTNDDDTDEGVIHHSIIRARPLDVAHYFDDDFERRVYDDHGNFYGLCLPADQPFAGKKPDECKFKEGELVEVHENSLLLPGIISLLPISPEIASTLPGGKGDQTDNVYCVQFSHEGPGHSHLPECDLFRPRFPLNNSIKKRLTQAYKNLCRV